MVMSGYRKMFQGVRRKSMFPTGVRGLLSVIPQHKQFEFSGGEGPDPHVSL